MYDICAMTIFSSDPWKQWKMQNSSREELAQSLRGGTIRETKAMLYFLGLAHVAIQLDTGVGDGESDSLTYTSSSIEELLAPELKVVSDHSGVFL